MVLDVGEAPDPQDVIVRPVHWPVEVGQAKLVVLDAAVADTIRRPVRVTLLTKVTGEDQGGRWTGTMVSRDELSDADDGSLQHHPSRSTVSMQLEVPWNKTNGISH